MRPPSKQDGNCNNTTTINEKQFWEQFIQLYEQHPCLWNHNIKEYNNKGLREAAYNKLVEKARQRYPGADREFITKKIHTLRCSFRREYNKVLDSKKRASTTHDVYIPTLWYYDLLSFITTCGQLKNSQEVTEANDNDDTQENYPSQFVETQHATSPEPSAPQEQDSIMVESSPEIVVPSRAIAKRRIFRKHLSPIPTKTICYPKEAVDEFEIAGRKYASDIRNMNQQQRLIAEKLVAEVIYNAKMEQLNVNSYIQLENNFH